MRNTLVMGNWKMNGSLSSIRSLIETLQQSYTQPNAGVEVVVLPPSIYLAEVAGLLANKTIKYGAQNMHSQSSGAFTGEISAAMLRDFSCDYVLVGHSERRSLFAENEKFIAEKFHQAKEHDMIPVLCIGETEAEREKGLWKAVLARQLQSVAVQHPNAFSRAVVAYEPVWAIGTGKTASPELIQEVHSEIRSIITDLGDEKGEAVSLLYGGSVNEQNAKSIFAIPDVDGGLIGGASLDAHKFLEIVKCIN